MPATDRKLRVFLCHASQDKPIVRELYQRLLAEGWIDPWLDEEKLLPGQDWDMEIERAVEAADAVIVCLSDASVAKDGYVQKEIRKVLDVADEKHEDTIFIVPIRLDNCQIPRRLKRWQYLDYFSTDKLDLAMGRLIASLKLRADSVGIGYQTQWVKTGVPERIESNEIEFDKTNELLAKAIMIVIQSDTASVSFLQMRLRINHDTAVKLLDQLEKLDVIATSQGNRPERDVLIKMSEYEKYIPIIESLVDKQLLGEAIKLILQAGYASASMLQRRMRIGYTRAVRIVDYLEEIGIVGPLTGSTQTREVLIK